MVTPCWGRAELAQLDKVPLVRLDDDFVSDLKILQHKIFKETPPKRV